MHYSYRNVSRELMLCLPIPNWLQWPHSWHVLENHPTRISCMRLKIYLFLAASCANIEWIGQAIDLSSQRTFHFNRKPLMWLMPQTHQISFSKCLEFRSNLLTSIMFFVANKLLHRMYILGTYYILYKLCIKSISIVTGDSFADKNLHEIIVVKLHWMTMKWTNIMYTKWISVQTDYEYKILTGQLLTKSSGRAGGPG